MKRDLQALIAHSDHQVKRLGHNLLRPTKELFWRWVRYRDGTISRTRLKQVLASVRDKVNALLLCGYGTAVDGMCRELYNHPQWVWMFRDRGGVDPPNNAAKWSLRACGMLSFGGS